MPVIRCTKLGHVHVLWSQTGGAIIGKGYSWSSRIVLHCKLQASHRLKVLPHGKILFVKHFKGTGSSNTVKYFFIQIVQSRFLKDIWCTIYTITYVWWPRALGMFDKESLLAQIWNQHPGYFCCILTRIFNVTWYFSSPYWFRYFLSRFVDIWSDS